ncbi:MAG TPA: endolytic transglycosylase MltG [Candidatus Limnocylindrales bacterium]
MTLRSGRKPRDRHDQQARPYDPDAYATETSRDEDGPIRQRGDRGGPRRSGWTGLLRFAVFALVLAAIVLTVALTALRPAVNSLVLSLAEDNPAALQLPFVKDIVREDLGAALTTPVSSDSTQVEFLVEPGDTARSIADRLQSQGLLGDSRAFVFIAIDRQLTGALQQGTFVLRRNLTPDQLVSALLNPPVVKYVDIELRTGLRLEQVTAKLETLTDLQLKPEDFYRLVKTPPASLLADYPWLEAVLADAPEGASLEGFLWPSSYRVLPDTTAEELVRLMLDKFIENVGEERLTVPASRGLTAYQVIVLASIVEREAKVDEEKPLIAGVYTNRLDPKTWPRGVLEADPTVIYAHDTAELGKLPVPDWQRYSFWGPIGGGLADYPLPPFVDAYNTYSHKGLPPGPLSTPTIASIDAALEPDTSTGYLYFVAKGDGSGTSAFARTFAEHQANIKKYLKK